MTGPPVSLTDSEGWARDACCAARLMRWIDGHHGMALVGREDISVVELVAQLLLTMGQTLHDWREEVERVAADVAAEQSARGKQQLLLVIGQLPRYILRVSQDAVHAGIVLWGEEIGDVTIGKGCHVLRGLHVYLRGDEAVGDACLLQARHEVVDTGGQGVGHGLAVACPALFSLLLFGTHEHDDAVGTGHLLIDAHGLLVARPERQEGRDVLLVVDMQQQQSQHGSGQHKPHRQRAAVKTEVVIETKQKTCHGLKSCFFIVYGSPASLSSPLLTIGLA